MTANPRDPRPEALRRAVSTAVHAAEFVGGFLAEPGPQAFADAQMSLDASARENLRYQAAIEEYWASDVGKLRARAYPRRPVAEPQRTMFENMHRWSGRWRDTDLANARMLASGLASLSDLLNQPTTDQTVVAVQRDLVAQLRKLFEDVLSGLPYEGDF